MTNNKYEKLIRITNKKKHYFMADLCLAVRVQKFL